MPKGYKGRDKTERLHVLISDEELTVIDNWRFANRVPTRGDAVRRLIQVGLRAERALLGIIQATTGVSEELEEVIDVRRGATEAAESRDPDALLKAFGGLFKAVDRVAGRQILAYDQIMALVAEVLPFITNPDLIEAGFTADKLRSDHAAGLTGPSELVRKAKATLAETETEERVKNRLTRNVRALLRHPDGEERLKNIKEIIDRGDIPSDEGATLRDIFSTKGEEG